MVSLRRLAFSLAVCAFAGTVSYAQSSSSDAAPPAQQPAAQQPATSGPLTVQARLRARREQRRAAAIHDVYSHLYEAYVGSGYERFTPGPGIPAQAGLAHTGLQRMNEYMWDVGVTRYFSERLGATVDVRGVYGTAFVGLNPNVNTAIPNPSISQYAGMIGPTYRFLLHPKYSVSGRILGGVGYGNFSGDLGAATPAELGLYPSGITGALSASVPVEYNLTPGVGLRVAPEYFLTTFGSTVQNNLGFTAGVVIRWGKQ
jgi:hypothetical protein